MKKFYTQLLMTALMVLGLSTINHLAGQTVTTVWERCLRTGAAATKPSWFGGGTERGIAYNPFTDHILVASRSGGNSIKVINAADGTDITPTNLFDLTTVTGGTLAWQDIEVAEDGAIVGCNIGSTTLTPAPSTMALKVYIWANEANGGAPVHTKSFTISGVATATTNRLGDKITVLGSWAAGTLEIWAPVASMSSNGKIYVFKTTDQGANWTENVISLSGALTNTAGNECVSPFSIGGSFYVLGNGVVPRKHDATGAYVSNSAIPLTMTSGSVGSGKVFRSGGNDYIAVNQYRPNNTGTGNTNGRFKLYNVTIPSAPIEYSGALLSDIATSVGNAVNSDICVKSNVDGSFTVFNLGADQGIGAYNVVLPKITITGTLNTFKALTGTSSAIQTYKITGSSLTSDITITAPTDFEVSTDGSTFSGSLTLTQTAGNVAETTIHVRMKSTATGNPTGNISNTSAFIAQNITVSGSVTYPVTFSVVGGNGTLSATVDASAIVTGDQVAHGKNVIFTASPASGYRVKEWKNNSVVVSGNTTNTYTLSNLTAAATVTVEFESIPTYAVNFSVVGTNGTLAAAANSVAIITGELVSEGKEVVFTASPASGYKVKEWKNNSVVVSGNTTNTYTLSNLTAAATVTVEFEPITYVVNFSVVGSNGTLAATVNSVAIGTGDLIAEGKDVVFTASPASGYRVKEWKNNSVIVSGNTTNTYTLSNLTAASTITVEFEVIPTITYAVNFSVVGGNGTLAATVNTVAINTGDQVVEGKDVVFNATPAAGYRVKEWKNNTAVVSGNTTNTYTLNNLSAAATVTVEFEPITYAVTFSVVSGNGTLAVTVNSAEIISGNQVGEGKDVVFTATPAAGYKVKEWKNNSTVIAGNTTNNYTLNNLTAAATVTVEFEPITYAVNFSVVGSNGTLAATVDANAITTGALVIHGKNVAFIATPASGYKVKEWKNNSTVVAGNTTNNYTLSNLTAAATVTVEFEPITYAVNFSVVGSNGTLAATVDANAITTGALVINGKNVVFTATPASGYKVKEWKNNSTVIAGNKTNTYTLSNLTAATTVTVEFEVATGINDNKLDELEVFPNPFRSFIKIKSSVTISRVEISNIIGQVVNTIYLANNEGRIDTENLQKGIYIIRAFDTNGKVLTRKMIKD